MSPTRFTPSLAGIVALEGFVIGAAPAGAAKPSDVSTQSPSIKRRMPTQRSAGCRTCAGGSVRGPEEREGGDRVAAPPSGRSTVYGRWILMPLRIVLPL